MRKDVNRVPLHWNEHQGVSVIVKVCVLASSSSGNATFVATDRTQDPG